MHDNFYESGKFRVTGMTGPPLRSRPITPKRMAGEYRGQERTYDFAGSVADEYPSELRHSECDYPTNRILVGERCGTWDHYRDYGEYIESTIVPDQDAGWSPKEGDPQPKGFLVSMTRSEGESLPAGLGDPRAARVLILAGAVAG